MVHFGNQAAVTWKEVSRPSDENLEVAEPKARVSALPVLGERAEGATGGHLSLLFGASVTEKTALMRWKQGTLSLKEEAGFL